MTKAPLAQSVSTALNKARTWQGHWRRMLLSSDYRRTWRMMKAAGALNVGGEPREKRMPKHLEDARRRAETLTPRPLVEAGAYEIHMLSGHSHVGMGCIALWSLVRWLPPEVSVYLHSDGSMTEADQNAWRRVFPNIHIVTADMIEPLKEAFFADGRFPLIKEFSKTSVYSPKVVDFHLIGSSKVIVSLDTDVLFFKRPDELIRVWDQALKGDRIVSTFFDIMNAYLCPLKELDALIGPVPRRFNSGMCILPRLSLADFQEMEDMYAKVGAHDPSLLKNIWLEQTTHAWLAAKNHGYFMGPQYVIGQTLPGSTAVHYAGVFRELYFAEGLPLIFNDRN
ncbi:hypothetical protein [Paludisphaera rhizosphaerae]|uniref:hypothetical protein n=1 Tax=Paludisphaera rhizosphaerae TaxID=2711216 RepID=UPI0013EE05B3|nr:hypothetical protein [Paludisphaera rhizosphaerae]